MIQLEKTGQLLNNQLWGHWVQQLTSFFHTPNESEMKISTCIYILSPCKPTSGQIWLSPGLTKKRSWRSLWPHGKLLWNLQQPPSGAFPQMGQASALWGPWAISLSQRTPSKVLSTAAHLPLALRDACWRAGDGSGPSAVAVTAVWSWGTPREKQLPAGVLWNRARVNCVIWDLQIPEWTPMNAVVQENKVGLAWEQNYLAAFPCSGLTCELRVTQQGNPALVSWPVC